MAKFGGEKAFFEELLIIILVFSAFCFSLVIHQIIAENLKRPLRELLKIKMLENDFQKGLNKRFLEGLLYD